MAFKDPEARRAYHRQYAKDHPAGFRLRNERVTARLKAIVDEACDVPCMDCDKRFPTCVMDFDHRDRATKVASVSRMIRLGNKAKLLAEIAKCDVVCANCHRIRTHVRS